MKQILVNNFANKLINQQIRLYFHNIHKNNYCNNNTNRINLYYLKSNAKKLQIR